MMMVMMLVLVLILVVVMVMMVLMLILILIVVMVVAGAVRIVALVVIVVIMMMVLVRLLFKLLELHRNGGLLLHGGHQLLAGELVPRGRDEHGVGVVVADELDALVELLLRNILRAVSYTHLSVMPDIKATIDEPTEPREPTRYPCSSEFCTSFCADM